MSRSGYNDDSEDTWSFIRWRGAVNSAINGARGQAFLRELLTALDAMPEKELVSEELQADGSFCALGVVGKARGIDLEKIDTEDFAELSKTFGIAESLAREIMYENDESVSDTRWTKGTEICGPMRPYYPDFGKHAKEIMVPNEFATKERWHHMHEWAIQNLKKVNEGGKK